MLSLALAALLALPVATAPHALKHDLKVDATVTAVEAAAWISTESVFKSSLAPSSCRWCDRTLNPVDRAGLGLAGSNLKLWDLSSSAVGFVLLPLATLSIHAVVARNDDALDAFPLDALLVAQAVLTTLTFNQAVKFIAGRQRPFVHEGLADGSGASDYNLSFFSGHSSFAFSVVAASATIAELRGYSGAKWIWIIGLPLAATVPLMRMAAEKHYLTDVLVGSAVGLGIGIGLPRLFHGREDSAISLTMAPGGAALTGRF